MAECNAASKVEVSIIDGPIVSPVDVAIEGAGAVIRFDGVIRPTEDGRQLRAIDYGAYQPMAQQQLQRIAQEAVDRHQLLRVSMIHSRGVVPIMAASLRLIIAAKHRKPALQAMDEIIDALKADVPIWKTLVFEDDKERAS